MRKRLLAYFLILVMTVTFLPVFAEGEPGKAKVAEAAFGTPVIDGEIDAVWNETNAYAIGTIMGSGIDFYKGWFKVLWDNEKLYMLSKVYVEQFDNMSASAWEHDSIEFFLDENCDRATKYQEDDYQLRIGYDSYLTASNFDVEKMEGTSVANREDMYFISELAIPYKTVIPYDGMEMGFDVQVNASKSVAFPRTLYSWNVKSGSPQANTSTHGTLALKKTVIVKRFEEPTYQPRPIDIAFYGVNQIEKVARLDDVITSFDGKTYTYPVVLVNEYPAMEIGELATVVGGAADGNTLTVGATKLTYTADSRLAGYNDGHLMLERCPKMVGGRLYVPLSSLIPTTGWTVEYQRFNSRIIIETGTHYPEPEQTFYAKDYGAVGDGVFDDKDAILKTFKAAAAAAQDGVSVKMELEAGKTYRVSEKQDAYALFDLDNVDNFVFEGNGSTILFERPTNSFVNIEGCTNVRFHNVNVEFEEHVTTYGVISSVDVKDGTFHITIPEGTAVPADNDWAWYYVSNETPFVFGSVMDAVENRLKFLSFDHLRIDNITKISDREYKVEPTTKNENYMKQLEIGDRFAFKSRWTSYDFGEYDKYGRPCFIYVSYSKDVSFDGVKTTGSLLMFAPMTHNDGRIVLRNCELVLKPGTLITTNADGVHATKSRFGVIIENCTFRNSLDDFINTNQHAGVVMSQIDDAAFEVNQELFYRVGDEIRFFNRSNHEEIGTGFLKAFELLENGNYRLTLDRPIEKVAPKDKSSVPTIVYNMSAANNGNIIRNNKFLNCRRHAYIVRAANSLIENNYMENNGGAATEATNEIHGDSNEGAYPSAITIRNNTIVGDGINGSYSPISVYSWDAKLGEQAVIDGALIENNTIDVPAMEGAIRVNSVTGLYMLNNTIRCDQPLNEGTMPIQINNSSIQLIDGLHFEYSQNVNAVVNIVACEVDESNIKNINIAGGNTAKPYSIK